MPDCRIIAAPSARVALTAALGLTLLATGCSDSSGPPAPAERLGSLVPLPLPLPVALGSSGPKLSAESDGTVILSWVEPDGEGHSLKYATWQGDAFSAPVTVARGDDWVVTPADMPAVRKLGGALWAADWRVTSAASPYAYDVRAAVSRDGRAWEASLLLNDDGTPTEHGFVSWFADGSRAGAVWLDGRDNDSEDIWLPSPPFLGTSVRFASLDAAGAVVEQGVLDAVACDCCQTDAVLVDGQPVVVYRDRTEEEIRDIVVRRRDGAGWLEPVTLGPDGWHIEGCPVNGPNLDAAGDALAVAWFTAADGRPRVRFARSRNGGASFAPAVDIDDVAPIGHVGVTLSPAGDAYVTWWRSGGAGGSELMVRRIGSAGELAAPRTIATSASSRPDDVPQVALTDQRLLIAWTEPGEAGTIKAAYVELLE